jgi:hypothetical protein
MFKLSLFCTILLCLLTLGSYAQDDWIPGTYHDANGGSATGFIRPLPHGPIKNEACIEFKPDKKSEAQIFSASALQSIIMGRDSFVVAEAPQTSEWDNYLDFVRVVFDDDNDDMKLYMFQGSVPGRGGVHPEFGVGLGAAFGGGRGGFGYGLGGGISIPIGGGGGGRVMGIYYYGNNTAHMKQLTSVNFVDIMSQMLGDEPEIVGQLHDNKYSLKNIDKLMRNYDKLRSADQSKNQK